MWKAMLIGVVGAVAALLVSVAVWSHIPDPMPIHWNAAGVADGFAPRALGLLLMPATLAVIAPVVGWACRSIAPSPKSERAVAVILLALAAFLLGMHVLMIQAAMRSDATLSMGWVMSLMGLLFAVLGGVMPMLPPNKVAGIRTPWTLGSETNWRLTHTFGGWTMGIGGVVAVIAGMLLAPPALFWVAFSAIMVGSLLPVAYSYLLHRVEKDRG